MGGAPPPDCAALSRLASLANGGVAAGADTL
jgi:hypothetical protein